MNKFPWAKAVPVVSARSANANSIRGAKGDKGARPGASLIEMVTAIALLGGLLTVTSTTLYRVIRTEAVARRANDRMAAVAHSAIAFRRDIHGAIEIALGEDGRTLTCRLPDGSQVGYVVEPSVVRRTEQSAGDAVTHREAFVLHEATVRFESRKQSGRAIYTMLWQLPPSGVLSAGTNATQVPIPIEAIPRREPVGN